MHSTEVHNRHSNRSTTICRHDRTCAALSRRPHLADQDLTPLLLDALGKRIEDPAAIKLTTALGKKPFKSAALNYSHQIADRKRGLEVASSMKISNRAYRPFRKEGRVWVTWVSHALVYASYRGSLPAGFDWQMDDSALSARFKRRVEGFSAIFASHYRRHVPACRRVWS